MTRALVPLLLASVVACADDSSPEPEPTLAECRPPQWASAASAWGARCRTFEDCPNTEYPTTVCELSTGGYCTELSGPDFVAEGQPCASDGDSIGLTIGSFRKCLAACAGDADCRPGYTCAPAGACLAIDDCATHGCNDAGATTPYYCDDDGGCWQDDCAGAACGADELSTGACHRAGDAHRCECVSGEHWDPDCQRCGGLLCDAVNLGRLTASGTGTVGGDTCEGAGRFDPTANGCTGWAALGPDTPFQLTLAPQTGATLTASPVAAFDIALYLLEDCFDFSATTCLFGEDAAGPEVAHVANDSDEDMSLVAVVDGAQPDSCGAFELLVEPFAFQCDATDLGTFTGVPVVRTESNCAGSNLYNPGLRGCTANHAAGSERVYRLVLPAQTTATVTMTPSGFDASLYAISRCGDYGAASCTAGSDGNGRESITIGNGTATPKSSFLVADSFNIFDACGTYELRIE